MLLTNTYMEMPDMWIMFGCGSGSVIAACRLYPDMICGQWIPFSNTDKQQDDEDKGQCWHQVWKLESWMILLNILGPAHGGLQLLNTLSIWLFSRPSMTNLGVGHGTKFFECVFYSGITEDSILLVHDILTLGNQILKFFDRSSWISKMRMLHSLKTMGSNYPFLDHHIPEKWNPQGFLVFHRTLQLPWSGCINVCVIWGSL